MSSVRTLPARVPGLLSEERATQVRSALVERGLDGWLLYEFRGQNWISASLLGVGNTTRRAWVLFPREGNPCALVHATEGSAWKHWPFDVERYTGWREMERKLQQLLTRCRRVALEVSPGSAVPTVDTVPTGALELVRAQGGEVVSSADLVTTFHSVWSDEQLADHRRAAEVVAEVGQGALRKAGQAILHGSPLTEGALSRWVLERLHEGGVAVEAGTLVAAGAASADPHYGPSGDGARIEAGQVLLVDLWGRMSVHAVHADQTWMGFTGRPLPNDVAEVWQAVKDAREAAVDLLRRRHREGASVRGMEVDDVARHTIGEHGYADFFVHRTGHSIDTQLHGSGPNLDNLETRDDRVLVPGVGFSVEPGVYWPGRFGVRSEVNVHWGVDGPAVTPRSPQEEILLVPEF